MRMTLMRCETTDIAANERVRCFDSRTVVMHARRHIEITRQPNICVPMPFIEIGLPAATTAPCVDVNISIRFTPLMGRSIMELFKIVRHAFSANSKDEQQAVYIEKTLLCIGKRLSCEFATQVCIFNWRPGLMTQASGHGGGLYLFIALSMCCNRQATRTTNSAHTGSSSQAQASLLP